MITDIMKNPRKDAKIAVSARIQLVMNIISAEPKNSAIEVMNWAMLRFSVRSMVSISLVMRLRMSPKGVESKYLSGRRLVLLVMSVRIRLLTIGATVAMMKCWMKFISQLIPYRIIRKTQVEVTASRSIVPVMPTVIRSVIFWICLGPIREMTVPMTAQVIATMIAGIWGLA